MGQRVGRGPVRLEEPPAPGGKGPKGAGGELPHQSGGPALPRVRLSNPVPVPAPQPSTSAVAAAAPVNLAAVSMSREMAVVCKLRLEISRSGDSGLPSCRGRHLSAALSLLAPTACSASSAAERSSRPSWGGDGVGAGGHCQGVSGCGWSCLEILNDF